MKRERRMRKREESRMRKREERRVRKRKGRRVRREKSEKERREKSQKERRKIREFPYQFLSSFSIIAVPAHTCSSSPHLPRTPPSISIVFVVYTS